jgi:alkylation response protein AidB-like acyl-CoA dehydrogenase
VPAADRPAPAALLLRARQRAGDITGALEIAEQLGTSLARATHREIVDAVAALAAGDLTVARVLEPHLDALIILREADRPLPSEGSWGVFAAEDPRRPLRAEPSDTGWRLSGTKPWCSLAGLLDRALVTAQAPDGNRLFAVDLTAQGVQVADGRGWVAHGLPAVTSVPVEFDATPAEPVGAPGWYLDRPGFGWGAVRVAACWLGGLTALVDQLREQVAARHSGDPLRGYNLGQADLARWSAELAVNHAATAIDADYALPADQARRLAARTRAVVAGAVEVVLTQVGHALGPAPLAFDAEYAQRVADLTLYVRQHHAERDLSAHGLDLASAPE